MPSAADFSRYMRGGSAAQLREPSARWLVCWQQGLKPQVVQRRVHAHANGGDQRKQLQLRAVDGEVD